MKTHKLVAFPDKKYSLDLCLTALKSKGGKVLDYWRQGGQWVFKLSVPKDGAVSA